MPDTIGENWNIQLYKRLNAISLKLHCYLDGNPHLADKDIGLITRTINISTFMADVINDEYNTEQGLPEIYFLAITKEFSTLIGLNNDSVPSLLDIYHFYWKCRTMLSDHSSGVIYHSPSQPRWSLRRLFTKHVGMEGC